MASRGFPWRDYLNVVGACEAVDFIEVIPSILGAVIDFIARLFFRLVDFTGLVSTESFAIFVIYYGIRIATIF